MPKITLETHPLNILLTPQPNKIIQKNKILDLIPSINVLNAQEQIRLINRVVVNINKFISDETYYYYDLGDLGADGMRSRIKQYLPMYDLLLDLDKERKSYMWDPDTIAYLDQFYEGQKIVAKYDSQIFNNKKYSKAGLEVTVKNITNWGNELLHFKEEKIQSQLEYFESQFVRYKKKPQWEPIFAKNPNMTFMLLAQYNHYSFNEKELLSIFNNFCDFIKKPKHSLNDEKISLLSKYYCQLLIDSKSFINTIAPQKNIKLAVSRFLKRPYTENSYDDVEVFINSIIDYKEFFYVNINLKVEKNKKFQLIGKYHSNLEENLAYKEALSKTQKPTVKKNKL